MQTSHIDDLDERQDTYRRFWAGEKLGRPILGVHARRDKPLPHTPSPPIPGDPTDMWLDPDFVIPNRVAMLAKTHFMGDSIPHVIADLGPGSLASYLGSPTECRYDTVWYKEAMTSLREQPRVVDEDNTWWQRHHDLISKLAEVGTEEGFYVALPDMIEGLDTLASLRGSQELVLDLMDEHLRDLAHNHLENIRELYLHYYNKLYDIASDDDGWSICTYLETYSPGRSCKIQCDFAALMDPRLFEEFGAPFIEQHARNYDHVSYHLDGPGAIYTAPMLVNIDKVRVIQWIPGAGASAEYHEEWDEKVLDTLIGAGKVVEMVFMAGFFRDPAQHKSDLEQIVAGLTRLIEKYGPDAFWFTFKYGYSESLIREVLEPAAREWGVDSL